MKNIIMLLIFISLSQCKPLDERNNNCIRGGIISILYQSPFEFKDNDTLYIDDIKFAHSYVADSIQNGKFLPKEKLVFFEVQEKQAHTKSNSISIGRILAKKLMHTGDYKILNSPELLTTGVLKLQKKNKSLIEVCTTPNYAASIEILIEE